MKQIAVSVPLSEFPSEIFPRELLEKAQEIRFVRCDIDGFVLTGHVQEADVKTLVGTIGKNYKGIKIKHVGSGRNGSAVVRVTGGWWDRARSGNARRQSQVFRMLRAMAQAEIYALRLPEVRSGSFRFILVGDPAAIRGVHRTFKKIGIEYSVTELVTPETASDSPLDLLTGQQMRILRLAYSLGYYEVPRRVSTEALARLLKMNRGTVGEHLRRAEKHVFDWHLS